MSFLQQFKATMQMIQTELVSTLFPPGAAIDYTTLAIEIAGAPVAQVIPYLAEELPYMWRDAYFQLTPRKPEISRVQFGGFEFICDDYQSLEVRGTVPQDLSQDSRVVAVCGCSNPSERSRDDYRLRGWIGPTNRMFGSDWDKGHFIAHSIGGSVDQCEINVFVQRRRLNRGWSEEGKRYRLMEGYCVEHPTTFCFSRPLYLDGTCRPSVFEFGVLQANSVLWVEAFDNKPDPVPLTEAEQAAIDEIDAN